MNLKYIKIAEAVALDKTDQEICCAIWEVKDLREKLLELIERKVKEEVGKICGRNFSSCFRASMASDLKSFSYEEQEKEFVEQCPILNRVITAAAVNERNLKRNKIKCTDLIKKIFIKIYTVFIKKIACDVHIQKCMLRTKPKGLQTYGIN